ncbi:hypothetical protein [Paraburkholderia bannensis]|uniref:hypothetical protein n=1 Tax=Paraburkholderia bannensis TaxID=765414 RepID=UPI002AB7E520|nr:hypothetical protein [Paraburkholderia bannensis]
MFAISFLVQAADVSKKFTPSPGVVAVIEIEGSSLTWKLSGKSGDRQGGVILDTEKTSSIEIGSYDFSGRLGFLVSHIDDGMGAYKVSRVFTFSPSSSEFIERFPSCGDEFDNLKVDKKRRYLTSTYWDQNTPKRCVTRLKIEK